MNGRHQRSCALPLSAKSEQGLTRECLRMQFTTRRTRSYWPMRFRRRRSGGFRFCLCLVRYLFSQASGKSVELPPYICRKVWFAIPERREGIHCVRHDVVGLSPQNELLSLQVIHMRQKDHSKAYTWIRARNKLNKGIPSIQHLRVNELHSVMFMHCDNEAALFLVHALKLSPPTKLRCCIFFPSISMLFCYLIRYEKGMTAIEASWCGPRPSSFGQSFLKWSCRRPPCTPCFSTRSMFSNKSTVIGVDCVRPGQIEIRRFNASALQAFLRYLRKVLNDPSKPKDVEASTSCDGIGKRNRILAVTASGAESPKDPCKCFRNCNQVRNRRFLSLPPTKTPRPVRQPSWGRDKWRKIRSRRIIKGIVTLRNFIVTLWELIWVCFSIPLQDLLPNCSTGSDFVEDLPHEWIFNYRPSLAFVMSLLNSSITRLILFCKQCALMTITGWLSL